MATIDSLHDNIEDIKNSEYEFVNIVFEGGGCKGLGYVGALQVLEECGIARKIKRICGASTGAFTGALFAVGIDSKKLGEFLCQDFQSILIDHKWGILSLLPNIIKKFGWNPGNRLLEWLGDALEEQTGNADITFKQVLEKYGKELCVVVTNLSQMTTEYLHPKTTPDMPIRKAVRMSMSIPGIFQAVSHHNGSDEDVYVDGGLLCNYPIHAFDGWWLSMKHEDSFFSKFKNLRDYGRHFEKNERFGGWNSKTVGFLLYSNQETDIMKCRLSRRPGYVLPKQPSKSVLYRQRKDKLLKDQENEERQHKLVEAVERFLEDIHRMGFDDDGLITLDELQETFEKAKKFTLDDSMLVFGTTDCKDVFKKLDENQDGMVTFQEIKHFVESKGINMYEYFLGYKRINIDGFSDFVRALEASIDLNMKRSYIQERDFERTVGIDTDYIESTDFSLSHEDKLFLVESGRRATIAFLRYHKKS